MKVLVAGGAGFIGSHLCEQLIETGNDVVAIDSFVTGCPENVVHLKERFKLIEGDIRHPTELPDEPFDQIYNMASPASPIDFSKRPIEILETGALGHNNLLKLALRQGAHILFASTSEVYGDPEEHPQKETYLGNVDPVGLRGCYDEAKRFGEALSAAYRRSHNLEIRIARIFNTYGPRMRPEDGRIIPNFFSQGLAGAPLTIFGDGTQTRSFCYVSDLVRGLIALMSSEVTSPVNLGNPTELSVLEMADTIATLTGNTAGREFRPLPERDPKKRRPDISFARANLAWEPMVSLEDGLHQTLEWFQSTLKL